MWQGIPPSADFVVLGHVATNSPEPPNPFTCGMRCVPKVWVVPSRTEPRLIWFVVSANHIFRSMLGTTLEQEERKDPFGLRRYDVYWLWRAATNLWEKTISSGSSSSPCFRLQRKCRPRHWCSSRNSKRRLCCKHSSWRGEYGEQN